MRRVNDTFRMKPMVWTTYKEKIKRLSQRIVDTQKPIRILDAIQWDSFNRVRAQEVPISPYAKGGSGVLSEEQSRF